MLLLRRSGLSRRGLAVIVTLLTVVVVDVVVFATAAFAQTDATGGGSGTSALPIEFQVFLSLINAGGFVLAVWGFIKGWMVPGYIHDQALERETLTKEELVVLRQQVDEKLLLELQRSRDAHETTRGLMERLLPIIERFILHAERQER